MSCESEGSAVFVPSPLSRWVKLYKPIVYFYVGLVFGYMRPAFQRVCRPEDMRDFSESDLVGIGTEDTFQVKKQRRFKRAAAWLAAPSTAPLTGVGATLFLPLLSLMGDFFEKARFLNAGRFGLWEFCQPTSPARKVLERYFRALGDLNDHFWLSARGPAEWSREALAVAATQTFKVVAGIFFRMVAPCDQWPLRLARLCDSGATQQERDAIVDDFCRCSPACYEPGFARPLREACGDQGELLRDPDSHLVATIEHALKLCPSHNIQNEDRFARVNAHHGAACRGRPRHHFSLAAAHVNSEAQAWHGVAMEQNRATQQQPATAARPGHQPSCSTGWQLYMSEHSKLCKGKLQSLSSAWADLSEAERASYSLRAQRTVSSGGNGTCGATERYSAADAVDLSRVTPFEIGDSAYPLDSRRAVEAVQDLSRAKQQWRSLIGATIGPVGGEHHTASFSQQCCDRFGVGRCRCGYSEAELRALQRNRSTMLAMARTSGLSTFLCLRYSKRGPFLLPAPLPWAPGARAPY